MREEYKIFLKDWEKSQTYDQQAGVFIYLPMISELGAKDHLLLCQLMTLQANRKKDAESKNDGWFPISLEEMKEYLHMSQNQQARFLNKVETLGYISRLTKGTPPIRYVRINYGKFFQEFEKRREELKHLLA